MKIDFHVHSKYSSDCFMKIDKIVETAKIKGLDGVAVVDHNQVGDFKQKFEDGFALIRGEEILTRGGEIIALNIDERIKPFMSVEDTVDKINELGGTIILPHPFCFWRKGSIFAYRNIKCPFAMEVMNGMAYFDYENNLSEYIARKNKLPVSAGSDAHRYKDIGRMYTALPNASSIDEILANLVSGKGVPHGSRASKFVHIKVFAKVFFKPAFNRWLED